MSFRLAIDGLKPDPSLALGLSALQWAAVLTLAYYARDIARWWHAPWLTRAFHGCEDIAS
jgi:hypothetical protein